MCTPSLGLGGFSLTKPQEEVWLGDPKFFEVKSVLDIECVYPEKQATFGRLVWQEVDMH